MISVPHGYTWKEVLLAFFLIVLVGVAIAFFLHPERQLARERDVLREEGVRNYMEALLEMRHSDEEAFARIAGMASAGKVMIGMGINCAGDFGGVCTDSETLDACLHPEASDMADYMSEIPIDPNRDMFSMDQTGYYMHVENGILEVGACNPALRDEIFLQSKLK